MASSVSQRRAGTVLPPPADDLSYSAVVSARHTVKNGTVVCHCTEKLKRNRKHFVFFALSLV
jgi:hypothetical protein